MVSSQVFSFSLPVELVSRLDQLAGPRSGHVRVALQTYLDRHPQASADVDLTQVRLAAVRQYLKEAMGEALSEALAQRKPSEEAHIQGAFDLAQALGWLGLTWSDVASFDQGTTLTINGNTYGTRATLDLLLSEFRSRAEPPAALDIDAFEADMIKALGGET